MTSRDADQAQGLRRMQWVATALLAGMAALFIATSLMLESLPALGIVRAFAEAAMIGGLADWFAVTALFRHPLGLPIPHTAIVPSRKNEIGQALARFVRDHFLTRDVIERRLARADLASRLGQWLEHEANAAQLSRDLGTALDWLMRAVDSAELRQAIKTSLREATGRAPLHAAFATLAEVLTSGDHAQALIDQLVQLGRDQLDIHRSDIRARIRDRSPWWMPKFVDEQIYDQLVSELERILSEVGENPDHPARAQFNARLKALQHSLLNDPEIIEKGRTLQQEFIDHPAVQSYVHDLWLTVREYLHDSFMQADSTIRSGLEQEIRSVGRMLQLDPSVGARLNRWLTDVAIYLVDNYRDPLSEIISETIEQWDPSATSERVELHIGRDLQFIRVNGTLVGGLVGVLIYLGWQAFAP
jgi:uncharacterized membrane-anchored protein YjiN (DUF445 family)